MFPQRPNVKYGKSSSSGVKPEGLYDAVVTKVVFEGSTTISIDSIVETPSTSLVVGIDGLIGSLNEIGLRPRIYAHIPRLIAGFEFGPLDFVGPIPAVGDRAFVGFKEGSTDNLVLLTKGNNSINEDVALSLEDLTDVTILDPELGQFFIYDGGEWTNASVGLGDFLPLAGGTMAGPLILSDDAISQDKQAVTKEYADAVTDDFLPLAGGTMVGDIDLDSNDLLNVGSLDATSLDMGGNINLNSNDILNIGNGYLYGGYVEFTSNDTFDKADYPGLRAVMAVCQGSGGAGGGCAATAAGQANVGGGGGGGGCGFAFVLEGALASSETVTVGVGGTGVSGAAGNNGNTSSFGSHASGLGGEGGGTRGASNVAFGVEGGQGGGGTGDHTISGSPGHPGWASGQLGYGGTGGSSHLGAGAYGRRTNSAGQSPGPSAGSPFGGGGSGRVISGSVGAGAGGDGANGVVRVYLYF